jgi:2',3'-cyclic-nucleotide 2'-phosphodiesterase (5'-nucleotidase family)
MNSILVICEANLTKSNPEGRLGNFIADLTLKKANEYCVIKGIGKADLCLLNNGGLRTSLPEGDILKRRVFELMPFENEIVIVTLTGNKTLMLFDYLAYVNGMPLAGARMGIKDGQQAEISIGGEPIDTNRTYRVATSDYLAHGGDRMKFFLTPLKIENLGHKLRDAIIEYMVAEHKAGRTINAQLDGRIKTME